MPDAVISLGSNMDPERHLPLALSALTRMGSVRRISSVYESEAVGPPGQPRFLNAAVLMSVDGTADELRARLRVLEAGLGRVRTTDKFAPRAIDLDLVALGANLDPEVATRAYLAATVAEVAPELRAGEAGEPVLVVAERLLRATSLRPRPDVVLEVPGGLGTEPVG